MKASMFDRKIVEDSLANILSVCNIVEQRSANITCGDDFAMSPSGMLRLDAVRMNLIAIGEAVKNLDKITHGELLSQYPQVYWNGVMRMRDKIAHHYFEVDADVVYRTIIEDIPILKNTIQQMLDEIR